ncbi:MAG: hypothetical protein ACRDRH_16025 [Pseudonocardia sp.]
MSEHEARRLLAASRNGAGGVEVTAGEIEIPGQRDVEPVPVDPEPPRKTLYAAVLAARDADRHPIVPAWARNRAEARALAV